MSFEYDVEILHLRVSGGHAYFGRARDGVADVATTDADRLDVVSGKELWVTRSSAKPPIWTLPSPCLPPSPWRQSLRNSNRAPLTPLLPRRNVVLRGAELAPLIGQDFTLESAAGSVAFHGGRHAHPVPGWIQFWLPARIRRCAAGAVCAAGR